MLTIFRHEVKAYRKSLLIWCLCVGGIGLSCILLFSSMQGEMEAMAEGFASMGAFADAFGMSQLSIATLAGFYATEIGTVHSLGGAMFAAIIGTCMLSKEEDGHTGEFLYTLPISRGKILCSKATCIVTQIVLFNLICVAMYVLGIVVLGEEISVKDFCLYHIMQTCMHIEVGVICFFISAFLKRNKLGLGLGVVLLLYAYDMIARVVPDLADYKVLSPFSYANAADILSTGKVEMLAIGIGIGVLLVCGFGTWYVYCKRDLAV